MAPTDQPSSEPASTPSSQEVADQGTPPEQVDTPVEPVLPDGEAERQLAADHEAAEQAAQAAGTVERYQVACEAAATDLLAFSRDAYGSVSEGLNAIEATKETNTGLGASLKQSAIDDNVRTARNALDTLATEGGQIEQTLETVASLRAQTPPQCEQAIALLEQLELALSQQLDKPPHPQEDQLSAESQQALQTLRQTAGELMAGFSDRIATLTTGLQQLQEQSSSAPSSAVSDTTDSAPTSASNVAEAATTPAERVAAAQAATTEAQTVLTSAETDYRADHESLISRLGANPFGPSLDGIRQTVQGLDSGTNWFWSSSSYEEREQAKAAAAPKVDALSTALSQLTQTIRQGLGAQTPDFDALGRQIDLFARDQLDPGMNAIAAPFQSLSDAAPLLSALQTQNTEIKGLLDTFKTTLSNLKSKGEAYGEAYRTHADAMTRQQAAETAATTPAAPPEATSDDNEGGGNDGEVLSKEEMAASFKQDINTLIESFQTASQEKNAQKQAALYVAAGLQAFTLLMNLMDSGDPDLFGMVIQEFVGEGEDGAGLDLSWGTVMELLGGLNVSRKMSRIFRKLTMEELYAFYQDPEGAHPDIDSDTREALIAFRENNADTYADVMDQIFDDQGGKEIALSSDSDKRDMSVFQFFTNNLNRAWQVTQETAE